MNPTPEEVAENAALEAEARAMMRKTIQGVFQLPPEQIIAVVRARLAALTDDEILNGPILAMMMSIKMIQQIERRGLPIRTERGLLDKLTVPDELHFCRELLLDYVNLSLGLNGKIQLSVAENVQKLIPDYRPPLFIPNEDE